MREKVSTAHLVNDPRKFSSIYQIQRKGFIQYVSTADSHGIEKEA